MTPPRAKGIYLIELGRYWLRRR